MDLCDTHKAQTRAWLELDASALINNVQQVRQRSSAQVMAVIKSNAYGHGMSFVARVLDPYVDAFAVATLQEALSLRRHFPQKSLTLLSGFYAPEQIEPLLLENIRPVIYSLTQLRWLEEAGISGLPLALKLDSGMGRLGMSAAIFAGAVNRAEKLSNDLVLMSHFACADNPEHELNEHQHGVFLDTTADYKHVRSFANSAAIVSRPQDHYELVRPGIMLYGVSPLEGVSASELELEPVMRLFARVLDVKTLAKGDTVGYGATWQASRTCRIGIASIGYGDGYPRVVGPEAQLAIDGVRYPLVGRVSMDSLAFLIEHENKIKPGTPVELWGETVAVDEVADWADTIAYELCCKVTSRVTRFETASRTIGE